uniref:Ig-like domain-containing protein n=1 Tax=Maylandia zebra TaxID=106582 RepID=A0A3P9D571_9CICH
ETEVVYMILCVDPTVTLQPSWTQIYSGETVTVRCEIQGGERAQWTYEWRAAKLNTPPTSNEYRIIRATESDSGGYSCRGKRSFSRTEWSDMIPFRVLCNIKQYFNLIITTYINHTVKLNTPPTSNEYRIITVTESDSGGYSCRGRRDYLLTYWSKVTGLTVSCKLKMFLSIHFKQDSGNNSRLQTILSFRF